MYKISQIDKCICAYSKNCTFFHEHFASIHFSIPFFCAYVIRIKASKFTGYYYGNVCHLVGPDLWGSLYNFQVSENLRSGCPSAYPPPPPVTFHG